VTPRDPEDGVAFELTVEGELGPVLRSALRPAVAEERPCTIFRSGRGGCSDVADLVGRLVAEGLKIESVRISRD
jgi:hypothetical protein